MIKKWVGMDLRIVLKRVLLVTTCIALPAIAWAQWTTSSSNIYNSNTGNVGIGTSSPSAKLDLVNGDIRIQDRGDGCCSELRMVDGSYETHLYSYGNGNFQIHKYGTGSTAGPAFTILNGGNVGIGTASPATLGAGGSPKILEISNTGASAYGLLELSAASSTASGDPTGAIEFGTRGTSGADKRTASIQSFMTAASAASTTGDLRLYTTNAGTNSEKVRIQANGNVGIGTTTPSTALDVVGDVTVSGNISAKYQDLAEWVPAVHQMLPGTVVVQDPDGINSVIPSTESYDTRVAGVVSLNPGIVLGMAGQGKVRVATTGRVKVHVDANRAPIRAGDLLVTSDKEGTAMRSEAIDVAGVKIHRPGTLIGKALESLNQGEGEILVLLSLQ